MPGSGHVFAEEIARMLAGGTEPFVRVANAYYLNIGTQAIAALQGTTSKRIASVKGIDKVIDESDTYPQTLRSEGATALHAHITSGMLDCLSGDGRMEMIVDAQQDVSARYGTCRDGTALLCVFNAGIDPLESVELRSLRHVLSAKRLSPSGEWGEAGVSDYGHGHFAIPVPLTTFETGIFKIQLK